MEHQGRVQSRYGVATHGITNANTVWWNLSTPALYEHALQRHEGLLAHLGPLVVRTGQSPGAPHGTNTSCGRRRARSSLVGGGQSTL